jgi:hypothetical protein
MWLSAYTYLGFMQDEVWPRLAGQHPENSFPFLQFCQQIFTIGCIWLAVVILFWTWRLSEKRKTLPDA